ncbi:MAG: DUF5916 domain-containing protein [Bacteroidota bacterium]
MKTLSLSLILGILLMPLVLLCQESSDVESEDPISELATKRTYLTKATDKAPKIDGFFDDACWQNVGWSGNFIQYEPESGVPPTQETAIKILYDNENIFVAFRCYDKEPEKIVQRMSRRDGFDGDWVEINIDSYHDLRTAFSFTITAAGVKGDELVSNNGNNWDSNWNPIWYAKTGVDSLGWRAEVRIPLSQLRFSEDEQVWGIQCTRRDFRMDERSVWQPVDQNAGVWVSAFGELHGLKGIKPQKLIEIQPYVLGQTDIYKVEDPENPYDTGRDSRLGVGLDGKIGITSDFVLDFTINPDFGQVDADPSVVNLDGFQVFFSERRPFFIENRNIFNYRITGAESGGPFNSDVLFYSRRIGGAPHGYPDTEDGEYVDVPLNTSILGAAKFSGKTQKGLSIGILESVTAEEMAEIDHNGERREEIVEPLTNYFVGRIQQDINEGNSYIGGMFTAVNRDLDNSGLEYLHETAYTGGIDIAHYWKNRSWYVQGNGLFSRVSGTEEAITRTQRSFEHYFQRTGPGSSHLKLDSTRTSLTGHGGTLKLGKIGGNWKFETGTTWRSPGLELNDIGFMSNADYLTHFLWTGYQINKPFSIFRSFRVNYNHWSSWDFGGTNIYRGINVNTHGNFKNFWYAGFGGNYNNLDISNNGLFGGPALRETPSASYFAYVSTDSRKKLSFNLNSFMRWGFEERVRVRNVGLNIFYQPANVFNISVRPSYSVFQRELQFVDRVEQDGEDTYIVGSVDQQTISTSIRFNYSITPNLSIQFYGQPFVSRVRYSDFKQITDPLAMSFEDRFEAFSEEQLFYEAEDEEFFVDADLDQTYDYSFYSSDFTRVDLRSNLVMRWEYIPGSELFVVWSLGKSDSGDPTRSPIQEYFDNLNPNAARNTFLIKYTYRFLR